MCARTLCVIAKAIRVVAKATGSKKLAHLFVEWLTKAQSAELDEFRNK